MTVLGILASLIFLGWGSAAYFSGVDSAKTQSAKQSILSIAAKVQQYENDTGTLPSNNGGWMDVVAAMPSYFPVTPCDATDKTCTPTSTTSDFLVSSLGTEFLISDSATHPSNTLDGLSGLNGFGPPSATKCNTKANVTCTTLYYDSIYGFQGR